MGADIKALRIRIRSVDSTLHTTKAMGLVASSKIRRATDAMMKGRQYAAAVTDIVNTLAACPECRKSPYMQVREGETRLIVIAGDRGMAGGYNANVFRTAALYPDAVFLPIGKRACDRWAAPVRSSERFSAADARQMAEELCRDYREGKFGKLGIISSEYVSMLTQNPKVTWLLPLTGPEQTKEHGILFEPDEQTVLTAAVPEYVAGVISAAIRESFACEVAARRTAMDAAGKNAQQMIDDLLLQYNQARQSAITQEITEIVAGSGS